MLCWSLNEGLTGFGIFTQWLRHHRKKRENENEFLMSIPVSEEVMIQNTQHPLQIN